LTSPFALERFSALTGESLLAIDFEGNGIGRAAASSLDALAVELALERLAQLACPSIAVGGERPPGDAIAVQAARLRDRCDVSVPDLAGARRLAEAIARNPLASMAAVQLLRHSEGLSLHEALIAESLVYSTLQAGPEFAAWLAQRGAPRAAAPSTAPAVLVERSENRLELTINKPLKRNAFSASVRDALVEGLQLAEADRSIDRVVLRGNGPAFCAGGDLDEFGSLPDPATAHAIRSTRSAARLLVACADRVEAHVHGACVGAGIELPAFAARVVASPDAFFQLPEVAMGLVPGAGGTASIPRRIGRQRTAWLALAGERVDAQTALGWGLVDEVREHRSDAGARPSG